MKTHDQLARQLWAIGDLARLRILQLLPEVEDCSHNNNVSALAAQLGLAQPTISHHLRVLRQAGLVKNRKMCRDVFYWIDPEEAEEVLGSLRAVLRTEGPPRGGKPKASTVQRLPCATEKAATVRKKPTPVKVPSPVSKPIREASGDKPIRKTTGRKS